MGNRLEIVRKSFPEAFAPTTKPGEWRFAGRFIRWNEDEKHGWQTKMAKHDRWYTSRPHEINRILADAYLGWGGSPPVWIFKEFSERHAEVAKLKDDPLLDAALAHCRGHSHPLTFMEDDSFYRFWGKEEQTMVKLKFNSRNWAGNLGGGRLEDIPDDEVEARLLELVQGNWTPPASWSEPLAFPVISQRIAVPKSPRIPRVAKR